MQNYPILILLPLVLWNQPALFHRDTNISISPICAFFMSFGLVNQWYPIFRMAYFTWKIFTISVIIHFVFSLHERKCTTLDENVKSLTLQYLSFTGHRRPKSIIYSAAQDVFRSRWRSLGTRGYIRTCSCLLFYVRNIFKMGVLFFSLKNQKLK